MVKFVTNASSTTWCNFLEMNFPSSNGGLLDFGGVWTLARMVFGTFIINNIQQRWITKFKCAWLLLGIDACTHCWKNADLMLPFHGWFLLLLAAHPEIHPSIADQSTYSTTVLHPSLTCYLHRTLHTKNRELWASRWGRSTRRRKILNFWKLILGQDQARCRPSRDRRWSSLKHFPFLYLHLNI